MDLDHVLKSVVTVHSTIPADGFTASILGTERAGSGVVIRDTGLVLTIGYLITEAENTWLARPDGSLTPAHALAYDQETGLRAGASARPARSSGDRDSAGRTRRSPATP